MSTAVARTGFSRALCTVALANLAALVLLNALGCKSWRLLLVYPAARRYRWLSSHTSASIR